MLALRLLLFKAAFSTNLVIQMTVQTPMFFLLPRSMAGFLPKFWAHSSFGQYEKLVRGKCMIEGRKSLPQSSFIMVPKNFFFCQTASILFTEFDHRHYIFQRKLSWMLLYQFIHGQDVDGAGAPRPARPNPA